MEKIMCVPVEIRFDRALCHKNNWEDGCRFCIDRRCYLFRQPLNYNKEHSIELTLSVYDRCEECLKWYGEGE